MGYFDWTEDLVVGIRAIDEEHRKLVDMLNTLGVASRGKSGREVLKALIDGIAVHAAAHAAGEERSMQARGYPAFDAHKTEHRHLSAELSALRERAHAPGFVLKPESVDTLSRWLRTHITNTDRQYRDCLRAHGSS